MAKSVVVESDGYSEKHEYNANYVERHSTYDKRIFLASDSLPALKREIKSRGIKIAWIGCKTGCFSYGQSIVDECPYQPRY